MSASKIDYLTDLLECKSVTVTPEMSTNSVFCQPKQGFVRFIKDHTKLAYFIEVYQHFNTQSIENSALKACVRIEVEYTFFFR